MTLKNLPFSSLIVLSDSNWTLDGSVGKALANHVAETVPVYYVISDCQPKSDVIISKTNNVSLVNPKFEASSKTLELVFSLIPRINRDKILIWIQSPNYHKVLQEINLSSLIVFQLDSNIFRNPPKNYNNFSETINKSQLIVTAEEQISQRIVLDKDILTPVYRIPNENICDSKDTIDSLIENLKGRDFSRNYLNKNRKKNVLLLYCKSSCYVGTIEEHLNSYGLFSKHHITFLDGVESRDIDKRYLDGFDAVVIHFSIRVSVENHMFQELYNLLIDYCGLKVLFVQDDYDNLPCTYKHINDLNINVVYTVIKPEFIDFVYPEEKFPNTRFIYNLTGYVSYKTFNFSVPKIEDRIIDVFYRGRKLPLHYGSLGKEKFEIGNLFKEQVRDNSLDLNLDVESDDKNRIYGNAWYDRIVSSKAMLGTESGCNVFDFNGDLEFIVANGLENGLTEDEIYLKDIEPLEKGVKVNMISPKMFESIALKTALILYEGEYSGVLKPNRHFIPLSKDFSNFPEVIDKLNDDAYLQKMVDCAYEEISMNDEYSYPYFIRNLFDTMIDDEVSLIKPKSYYAGIGYFQSEYKKGDKIDVKYFHTSQHIISPPTITFQDSDDFYSPIEVKSLMNFEVKRKWQIFKVKLMDTLPFSIIKIAIPLISVARTVKFLARRVLSKVLRSLR